MQFRLRWPGNDFHVKTKQQDGISKNLLLYFGCVVIRPKGNLSETLAQSIYYDIGLIACNDAQ